MTSFRPGDPGSGGFGRRPHHSTAVPSTSPWLAIAAYGLAVLGLWATVIGWATPVADLAGTVCSVALLVAGAVLAGIVHTRRGRDRSVIGTATLVLVWAAFAAFATYVATAPEVVR